MAETAQSILDEIAQEVEALSDDEIAKAAAAIQARKATEKARMTPERQQKMRDREKRRRELNKAIMLAAKKRGIATEVAAEQAATAAAAVA